MSDISKWSTSAASNNDAPPDGWPEGQAPSTVNDVGREVMAAVARQYQDTNGTLVTAGSGNTYTLTTNTTHAALADQGLMVVRFDRANTGAATLNVDGLGAKAIEANSAALVSGDLSADTTYIIAYNATADTYDILNSLVGIGTLGPKDTVNNDDWAGTDLAVVNGGTGASDVGSARNSLGVPGLSLSTADFSGITAVEANALVTGDGFLVMDGTTAKVMTYGNSGVRVDSVGGTTETIDATMMNSFREYTNAAGCAVTLNATIGKKGNFIIMQQGGAARVSVTGTATFDSAIGEKTRTVNSVIVLVNKGSDVWAVYGDQAA